MESLLSLNTYYKSGLYMHKKTEVIITIAMLVLILHTCILSVLASDNGNGQGKKGKGQGKGGAEVGIGIYGDNHCTDPLSTINWGKLEPGSSKNTTCYIQNEGKTVLFLSVETSNWNPEDASNDINLNWDYGEQPLNPGEIIQVSLTLSVSAKTNVTALSFDITIIGSR